MIIGFDRRADHIIVDLFQLPIAVTVTYFNNERTFFKYLRKPIVVILCFLIKFIGLFQMVLNLLQYSF